MNDFCPVLYAHLAEFCFSGRVLCVSWHQSDNMLVTGASDSTVRVFNVTSGMSFPCWWGI